MAVPQALVKRLRASPAIEIQAAPAIRLNFCCATMPTWATTRRPGMHSWQPCASCWHGRSSTASDLGHGGRTAALFAELMALHYDPLYTRSQNAHLFQWPQRQTVQAEFVAQRH